MKNMQQYFSYLFALERTGMKYDLVNIRRMLNKLGNPHNNYQSIHIAGTNGKGATVSFIASILTEHGLKAGLFTSPHILRFNERIRVNGKCISDSYIKSFLDRNRNLIQKVKPSFFEVNTAMAFEYFAGKKVDAAIIECGLGGRLDSTNVLFPSLSVITQIGMDHMQYLGNTLRKIALEKIGIVKPGVDVIVSDSNKSLKNIFTKHIKKDNLFYLGDSFKFRKIGDRKFSITLSDLRNFKFQIPLSGDFQGRNAAAAVAASAKFLAENGIRPSLRCIQKGLSKVKENSGYFGRLESVRQKDTEYIYDVSHNPEGLQETYKALKQNPPDAVIFGMMEDKDIKSSLREVLKITKNIIFTKANYKRAADPNKLIIIAGKLVKAKNEFIAAANISEALAKLGQHNYKGKRILITGSFFLVSDAVKAMDLKKCFE